MYDCLLVGKGDPRKGKPSVPASFQGTNDHSQWQVQECLQHIQCFLSVFCMKLISSKNKNKSVGFVLTRVARNSPDDLPNLWPSNSRSNWNLEMLVVEERGKSEYLGKNLLEQGREPTTNSTHIWRRVRELNPGHIGGRPAWEANALTTGPSLLSKQHEVSFRFLNVDFFSGAHKVCQVPTTVQHFDSATHMHGHITEEFGFPIDLGT